MEARVGLLFLFVLGISMACDARQLVTSDLSIKVIGISDFAVLQRGGEVLADGPSAPDDGNQNLCLLCQRLISEAIELISANKTQTVIIELLHATCSQVQPFKQQCITLVDYYAVLFFEEVALIAPGNFCKRANLCGPTPAFSYLPTDQDSCVFCQHAVEEVLFKLKDPDTQLEILEMLLKGCNVVEGVVTKCKRMVLEYGPLFLHNAQRFLETRDVCATVHACVSPPVDTKDQSLALADS